MNRSTGESTVVVRLTSLSLPKISWEGQTVKPPVNDFTSDLQWLFYVIGSLRAGHCDIPESLRFARLAS